MTAKEMVETYLVGNGFQGLCCDGCGCDVEDIAPCDGNFSQCVGAMRLIVTEENKDEHQDFNVGDTIYVPG